MLYQKWRQARPQICEWICASQQVLARVKLWARTATLIYLKPTWLPEMAGLPEMSGEFPANGTQRKVGMAGWGARIRTWEWWNQNPLPYHLATPQQAAGP